MKPTRTLAFILLTLATLQGSTPVMAASIGRGSSSTSSSSRPTEQSSKTQAHPPDKVANEAQDSSPGNNAPNEVQESAAGARPQKTLEPAGGGDDEKQAGDDEVGGDDGAQESAEGGSAQKTLQQGDEEAQGEGDAAEEPGAKEGGEAQAARPGAAQGDGKKKPVNKGDEKTGEQGGSQNEPGQDPGSDSGTASLGDRVAKIRQQFEKIPSDAPDKENAVDDRNIAIADVDIPGINKSFIGVSGRASEFTDENIQKLPKGIRRAIQEDIQNLAKLPATTRFQTQRTGDNDRRTDSERKILEAIAAKVRRADISGDIQLFTELKPCPSCLGVMKQFSAAFKNIRLAVTNGDNESNSTFEGGREFDSGGNEIVRNERGRIIRRIPPSGTARRSAA